MKRFFRRIGEILGLPRNSRYVKDYLNETNVRSGVFMSAIIVALEVWLVFRQWNKYISASWNSPKFQYGNFQLIFAYTSQFWLLMFFGAAMFCYCLMFLRESRISKRRMILALVFAGLSILVCGLIPLEFFFGNVKGFAGGFDLSTFLLIVLYSSVFIFDIFLILAAIYRYKGGRKYEVPLSIVIISLFAFVCLVFGVRVSYNDFASMKTIDGSLVPNPDYKQIICFLMMSLYVGCLLIWKPYVSIGILGTVFLGFYFMLKQVGAAGGRKFPDGDEVNYITFFISLTMVCISIYNQRIKEAQKGEELERLATKDTLTGLYSFEYFITTSAKKIEREELKPHEWVYLFMDITSFKIFNDQKGFEEGNKFLHETANILNTYFPKAIITRQSDDHFVIFAQNQGILEKLDIINKEIEKLDLDIRPGIKVGGYLFRDANEDPHQSVEKARYACAVLKQTSSDTYLEYDANMHDRYRMVQYVVRHIDKAAEGGWIEPYYQPVAWAKDETLCGLEALARWNDPRYGFLTPDKFVPALEDSQLAHKLDIAVLEMVCKNLRHCVLNNLPVIPVSINFSRMDFALVNIVDNIESIIDKYKIPHDLVHIEITESALMENGDKLKDAINRFHKKGFSLWLDDFGSGYSSLNALKEFEFDVLKLDMMFLKEFNNAKAKPLIKSAVLLAKQLGMTTVCEGVETKEQVEFLKEVGCDRLQGYYFGKPVPYKKIEERIDKKELKLSKQIKKGNK